jgi:hypothetical protein
VSFLYTYRLNAADILAAYTWLSANAKGSWVFVKDPGLSTEAEWDFLPAVTNATMRADQNITNWIFGVRLSDYNTALKFNSIFGQIVYTWQQNAGEHWIVRAAS